MVEALLQRDDARYLTGVQPHRFISPPFTRSAGMLVLSLARRYLGPASLSACRLGLVVVEGDRDTYAFRPTGVST